MNSLESKSSSKATFSNCFWRSVMFKTMALLEGADSGMLFLKAYAVYYVVIITVSVLSSLAFGTFDYKQQLLGITNILIGSVFIIFCVLLFCFIINLFLADNFMRIVNVFTFSGVHKWFLDILNVFYINYKGYGNILGLKNQRLIATMLENLRQRRPLTPEQEELEKVLSEFIKFLGVLSIFWMITFLMFLFLFVRNIRALRKK